MKAPTYTVMVAEVPQPLPERPCFPDINQHLKFTQQTIIQREEVGEFEETLDNDEGVTLYILKNDVTI